MAIFTDISDFHRHFSVEIFNYCLSLMKIEPYSGDKIGGKIDLFI